MNRQYRILENWLYYKNESWMTEIHLCNAFRIAFPYVGSKLRQDEHSACTTHTAREKIFSPALEKYMQAEMEMKRKCQALWVGKSVGGKPVCGLCYPSSMLRKSSLSLSLSSFNTNTRCSFFLMMRRRKYILRKACFNAVSFWATQQSNKYFC